MMDWSAYQMGWIKIKQEKIYGGYCKLTKLVDFLVTDSSYLL